MLSAAPVCTVFFSVVADGEMKACGRIYMYTTVTSKR